MRVGSHLRAVPDELPLNLAGDIYAEGRERALDREHWAQLHIISDRGPRISLGERCRRVFKRGGGTRFERGGFKFDERL